MIEGDSAGILSSIDEEEKRAKDNISRHYRGRQKDYEGLLEKRKIEKMRIMRKYYSSIVTNAEGYLKRQYDYVKLYEDYKVLIEAFDSEWERLEKRVAADPGAYVRFAMDKFESTLGKPERAVAGEMFGPHLRNKIETAAGAKPDELKLFKGTSYGDFSLGFIKELVMPEYADRAMGER